MTILLDTEFRGLVRDAIPKIIDLFWHSEEDVRKASSDALLKLSEQGIISSFCLNVVDMLFVVEFRESIKAAIPQIVSLLRPWKSYICELGADALVKLSEQGSVSIF
jgi:hypothetical protein